MKFFNEKINVVIVAGASGIGREIAKAYLKEDANVFVCDVSDKFIEQFKLEFPTVYIEKTDVADYAQVKSFFESVGKLLDEPQALSIHFNGIRIPFAEIVA